MQLIDATPRLTPFDEARRQIDEWEKAEPQAEHVVLILEGVEDLLVTVTGPATRATNAAGLCFAAAQAVLED